MCCGFRQYLFFCCRWGYIYIQVGVCFCDFVSRKCRISWSCFAKMPAGPPTHPPAPLTCVVQSLLAGTGGALLTVGTAVVSCIFRRPRYSRAFS